MTKSILIPLSDLRFGHEASPPINARRVGRDSDLAELAASIAAHGQIHPLAVRTIGGTAYVADGNRRLAAQKMRADGGEICPDEPIRCEEQPEDADAAELSVAANLMRAPLHEADAYETFRELADKGMAEAAIASRFGIEPKRVRKMLALGRLAPVVLEAWRSDSFTNQPAQCVQAFTLAPSVEEQEKVFERLKATSGLMPYRIREAFGAGDREVAKMLAFVGAKAYAAAGGHVVEDLFGENHAVSDPALAARLAREKLEAKRDEALNDGWSWASIAADLPHGWSWSWQKLGLAKKKATDEDKARSGVVVEIDHQGQLNAMYGVVKPADAKKERVKKEKAENGGAAPAPTVSNALAERLSIQATLATRTALTQEPRLGLVALLAGFLSGGSYGDPIRVRHEGHDHHATREREPFATTFERLSLMSDVDLFAIAAGIAGQAVEMRVQTADRPPFHENNGLLAAAIDAANMYAALRETFDAPDYFGSASKPLVVQAIREAVNDDEARKAEKMKKAELVEFALANVPQTGWLPPQLRTANYPGPGRTTNAFAEAADPAPAQP